MSLLRTPLTESRLPDAVRIVTRIMRSGAFVLIFLIYLVTFVAFCQRFILLPLTWLLPVPAARLMALWSRSQTRLVLRVLRIVAGVQITIDGAIGPENHIVIMNHQSVVDILVALSQNPGPVTIIPARRRYAWGIPGASLFVRLARFPLISQTRQGLRDDLAAMAEAAERCRRGEASFLVFPEGHRTKDGSILPFMTRGMRVVLSHAPLPVYCIVADGMWHVRTMADTVSQLAGSHIRVRIIGPFQPPEVESQIPDFLASIRDEMIATLHDIRTGVPRRASSAPLGNAV
jgi:1-acyl-sn-glycerol-3-phosphate acyltransferase